jgi:heme A synthase
LTIGIPFQAALGAVIVGASAATAGVPLGLAVVFGGLAALLIATVIDARRRALRILSPRAGVELALARRLADRSDRPPREIRHV